MCSFGYPSRDRYHLRIYKWFRSLHYSYPLSNEKNTLSVVCVSVWIACNLKSSIHSWPENWLKKITTSAIKRKRVIEDGNLQCGLAMHYQKCFSNWSPKKMKCLEYALRLVSKYLYRVSFMDSDSKRHSFWTSQWMLKLCLLYMYECVLLITCISCWYTYMLTLYI